MTMTIPADAVEEVRRRNDIVEVVSSYVSLRKAGRNYVGLCPFHGEKTPSFTVNREKQIFYCFGCGEGGNVVTFVMKVNAMTFPEAIRHLASRAGVSLPERRLTAAEREKVSRREQIFEVNTLAEGYFRRSLHSPAGERARAYLKNRGLKEETIETFRLGYSPEGWRNLRDFLASRRVKLELAEEAGLVVKGQKGGYYDRFRDRLIFPIHDTNGRVVAFGGRVIGEGEPKYLNSPESPVYVKGRILYGLGINREAVRREGYAIVVEGYLDLLTLWDRGIKNVVATLGTALTRDHVDLLRRFADGAAVVFDADEAGRKALSRSLGLFLAGGLPCRAVVLPEGYDPDDHVRAFGPEGFGELVAKARPAVEYYIDTVFGTRGAVDMDRTRLRESLSFLAAIENPVERNLFIRRIADRIGVDEVVLKREIGSTGGEHQVGAPERAVREARTSGSKADPLEVELIRIFMENPGSVPLSTMREALGYYESEELRRFGGRLCDLPPEKIGADCAALLDGLADEGLRATLLGALVTRTSQGEGDLERYFNDACRQIRRKWYRRRHRLLRMALLKAQEEGNEGEVRKLLEEKERLLQEEKEEAPKRRNSEVDHGKGS